MSKRRLAQSMRFSKNINYDRFCKRQRKAYQWFEEHDLRFLVKKFRNAYYKANEEDRRSLEEWDSRR